MASVNAFAIALPCAAPAGSLFAHATIPIVVVVQMGFTIRGETNKQEGQTTANASRHKIVLAGAPAPHDQDKNVQTLSSYTQPPQNRKHSHAALTAWMQNTTTTAELASGTAAVMAPSMGRVKKLPAACALTPPQPNQVNDAAARWNDAIAPAMLMTTRKSSRKEAACHAPPVAAAKGWRAWWAAAAAACSWWS